MKIYFDVKNQIITRTDRNQVIANSADYLETEITFTEEWASLEKTMTFKNGNLVYTYVLSNNKITQDHHLNLGVGTWKVSIIGTANDQKIITNECNLAVNASGWIGSALIPPESIWNQLLVIIQSLHTEAASSAVIRSAVQKYIEDNYDALVKEVIIVGNVKEIIDELVDDGTISELLDPIVAEDLAEQAGDWLEDHVDPDTGYVIDNSLTIPLAAADAKKVGDEVTNLKSALTNGEVNVAWSPSITKGKYYKNADGTIGTSSSNAITDSLFNGFGYRIAVQCSSATYLFKLSLYDATGDPSDGTGYITYIDYSDFAYIPSNAIKFGLTMKRSDGTNLSDADVTAFKEALSVWVATDTTLSAENKPADAKTTGDSINAINNALSDAIATNNFSDQSIWANGSIRPADGTNYSVGTRMRTKSYLPEFVKYVKSVSGKFAIYAYDENGYVGVYDPDTATFGTTWVDLTEVNLAVVRNAHPTYKFRVVWYLSSSHTIDIPTDYVNVAFTNDLTTVMATKLYTSDLGKYLNLYDKNASSLWSGGQISVSNGTNQSGTTRMRTGYLDNSIDVITANEGSIIVFAYDGDKKYVGVWNSSTNTFSKETVYTSSFADLSIIKAAHPYYQFRIVWFLSSSHTVVIADDYGSVTFLSKLAYESNAKQHPLFNKTVVFMGDSIFGKNSAPDDIPTKFARLSQAVCYNCAFGGTRAVVRASGTYKPFDLGSLVTAIVSRDFSAQDAGAEAAGDPFPEHLATLKSVDFSKVDVLVMNYGTNDWYGDVVIGDKTTDENTFFGAMKTAMQTMLAQYPQLRIVICTPIFRMISSTPADEVTNDNGKTLTDFVEAVKNVSEYTHAELIHNYYLGVNQYNYTSYYVDHTHPNAKMRTVIANHLYQNLC